jgi:hypothetical protein
VTAGLKPPVSPRSIVQPAAAKRHYHRIQGTCRIKTHTVKMGITYWLSTTKKTGTVHLMAGGFNSQQEGIHQFSIVYGSKGGKTHKLINQTYGSGGLSGRVVTPINKTGKWTSKTIIWFAAKSDNPKAGSCQFTKRAKNAKKASSSTLPV